MEHEQPDAVEWQIPSEISWPTLTCQGSLLYAAVSDVLLVRHLFDHMGSSQFHRNLLASPPCVLRTYHLFAMAIGCVANWFKNRSFHCGITAPLFFIAGIVFLLSELEMTHINVAFVWPFVFVGVGIAFLLEWRYANPVTS